MNRARLQLLHARAYQDLAAAQSAALVALGSRLGLYDALSGAPRTAPELALASGVAERFLQPWLSNQVASGFVSREETTGRYLLDEEQREVFARPGGPHALAAGFVLASELARRVREVEAAMRAGTGLPGEASDERFGAAMAALDPGKGARFIAWMPAGTKSALEHGGRALEIGCGDGSLLLALAEAWPRGSFAGLDSDRDAIEKARAAAGARGNASFTVGLAADLPPGPWDAVLAVETLHEVPDAAALARAVRATLAPGGAFLIAEPLSAGPGDASPATRLLSSLELQYCLPASLARGGAGLGPLTPPDDYVALLGAAGFSRVRRIEDPGRLLLEAAR